MSGGGATSGRSSSPGCWPVARSALRSRVSGTSMLTSAQKNRTVFKTAFHFKLHRHYIKTVDSILRSDNQLINLYLCSILFSSGFLCVCVCTHTDLTFLFGKYRFQNIHFGVQQETYPSFQHKHLIISSLTQFLGNPVKAKGEFLNLDDQVVRERGKAGRSDK